MQEKKLSFLWGVMAGIAFGTSSIFIRAIELDSHTIAVIRLAIASLVLLLFLFVRKKQLEIVPNLHVALMGILIAFHFFFFISAVKNTTIMAATVLVNTVPIITMILGHLFFQTPAKKREFFSVLLCFFGIVIIAWNDLRKGMIRGDVEALLAAFLEAIYLNIGARLRKTREAVSIMVPTYIVAFLVLLLFWRHMPSPDSLTLKVLLLLLAVGVIPTAFGHTLFVASLKSLKAFQTATLALLEPISATILAFFIFSEVPPLSSIAGALVIFSGMYILFSGDGK